MSFNLLTLFLPCLGYLHPTTNVFSSIGAVDTNRGNHDASIINAPGSDCHKCRDPAAFIYSIWNWEFFVILKMESTASPVTKDKERAEALLYGSPRLDLQKYMVILKASIFNTI